MDARAVWRRDSLREKKSARIAAAADHRRLERRLAEFYRAAGSEVRNRRQKIRAGRIYPQRPRRVACGCGTSPGSGREGNFEPDRKAQSTFARSNRVQRIRV